jgi:hypothetical protein
MRYIALLPIVLTVILMPEVGRADPPRIPSPRCSGSLKEHPKFTQVSPGRAEYRFNGLCVTYDGRPIKYTVDGTWTPSEAGSNANASEVFHVDALDRAPQTYTAIIGWRCAADPWLQAPQCQRVGENIPDDLRALWTHFNEDLSFPFSSRMIPLDQHPALIAEYDRFNGKFERVQAVADSSRIDSIGKYGTAPAAASQASKAGIIIVGGKASNRHVVKP